MLAAILECAEDELHFGREESGKPFLQNQLRHFSLTHTDELIALAVSTKPVGIDIEHSAREFNPRLAQRYFFDDENETLSKVESFNSTFASLWTLKEAYAKATGAGIFASISKLQIHAINPALDISSDEKINTADCWQFDDGNKNYTLSVVSLNAKTMPVDTVASQPPQAIKIQRVNADFSLQSLPTRCVANLI